MSQGGANSTMLRGANGANDAFTQNQAPGAATSQLFTSPPGATASQPAPSTTGTAQQNNIYQQAADYLTSAGTGMQNAMDYQPMTISGTSYTPSAMAGANTITPQSVSAGQIGTTNLSQYMNPYTQNVIDTSMADLDRQRQMTQQQNSASAAAAGAFGGSRQGLVEAETNRGFADAAARTTAGLQQQGFLNAQQMAGQDIASRMQAQLANQSAGLTSGIQNAANQLTTQQANQAATNQANQFGATQGMNAALANQQMGLAGAQNQLNAASQLGNLSNTGFNMGNTLQQQQWQQGVFQQQMQQQLLNDAMQQFYGYANSPLNYMNMMQGAISGSPLANNQTRTSQYQPGLGDYLSYGLQMIPFI